MNKALDMANLTKYIEKCKKCQSDKIYHYTKNIIRCFNCETQFLLNIPQDESAKKPSPKTPEVNGKNSYALRNNKIKTQSHKHKIDLKQEPEIIELLSSEDEESHTNQNLQTNFKDEDNNNELNNHDTNGENSLKINQSHKFIFKEWEIKETDTESMENVLNGKQSDYNQASFKTSSECFETKIKNFRLGSFISSSNSTFEVSSEGLNFKLTVKEDEEEDMLVSITICMQDIVYCAIVFHHPVYALIIRIDDTTSNLYYNQLKELKSFHISHIDQTNKSRITVLLDIRKNEEAEISRKLYSFFKRLPVSTEYPYRSNFIRLLKSKQLIYTVFRNDKNLEEVVAFTKECYADDLAKPLIKYPNGDDAVVISNSDLLCLNDGIFLNDNIISFYLKYLQYEILTEQDRKRTHIFDTFFYHCLTTKNQKKTKDEVNLNAAERRHSRVKNWTRNVNLFKKDFLIVPINKNSHWYLVIICYPYLSEPVYDENLVKTENTDSNLEKKIEIESNEPLDLKRTKNDKILSESSRANNSDQSADEADEDDSNFSSIFSNNKENNKICTKMPIILIFDSLLSTKKTRVIATLREYLQCEWKAKHSDEDKKPAFLDKLAGSVVKVPVQTNYFDCGIYLLQYVEMFFKCPITDFTLPITLDKWFSTDIINKKREYIKNIILKKSKEQTSTKEETKKKIKNEIKEEINEEKHGMSFKPPNNYQINKSNGNLKINNTNGHIKEENEDESKNKIKKFRNESQIDMKSPIIHTTRSFYQKKEQEKKSILDDMDNLIT